MFAGGRCSASATTRRSQRFCCSWAPACPDDRGRPRSAAVRRSPAPRSCLPRYLDSPRCRGCRRDRRLRGAGRGGIARRGASLARRRGTRELSSWVAYGPGDRDARSRGAGRAPRGRIAGMHCPRRRRARDRRRSSRRLAAAGRLRYCSAPSCWRPSSLVRDPRLHRDHADLGMAGFGGHRLARGGHRHGASRGRAHSRPAAECSTSCTTGSHEPIEPTARKTGICSSLTPSQIR